MGKMVNLTATDGHELGAYVAQPDGKPRGGVVIVQEIFGVNPHIKSVADRYAEAGYYAIAPALFDRFKRDLELKYDALGRTEGLAMMKLLSFDSALKDVAAAFADAKTVTGKAAVVGFCYGGLMAWFSATRGPSVGMEPACTVGYYAGGIGSFAKEQPACPVLLHFGADDSHIGQDQIEAVRAAHSEVDINVYAGADHGFNRDVGDTYNPAAAKVALGRTLEFLGKYVG